MGVNISSETVELVLKNLFGGIAKIHDQTYIPWLNNKRINKYKNYTLEKSNGELVFYENGSPVAWESLDSSDQVELIKFRNMNANGEVLNSKLEKEINNSENKEELANVVMDSINKNEDAMLYFMEKSKFVSDSNKSEILTDIISKKLSSDEEISISIFDFVCSLTKPDINTLQEIKKLMLIYQRDSILKNEIIKKEFSIFLPYILDNEEFRKLNIQLDYEKMIEFSMRGLFSIQPSALSIDTQSHINPNKSYEHKIIYNELEYKLAENNGSNKAIKTILLSQLGKDVLSHIPESGYIDNYIEYLNKVNLIP